MIARVVVLLAVVAAAAGSAVPFHGEDDVRVWVHVLAGAREEEKGSDGRDSAAFCNSLYAAPPPYLAGAAQGDVTRPPLPRTVLRTQPGEMPIDSHACALQLKGAEAAWGRGNRSGGGAMPLLHRALESTGRAVLEAIAVRELDKAARRDDRAAPDARQDAPDDDTVLELLLSAPLAEELAEAATPPVSSDSARDGARPAVAAFREALRALRWMGAAVAEELRAASVELRGVALGDDVTVALPPSSPSPPGEAPPATLFDRAVEDLLQAKAAGGEAFGLVAREWLEVVREARATLIVRDADGRDGVLLLVSLLLRHWLPLGSAASGDAGGGAADVGVSLYWTPAGVVSPVPPHVDLMDVIAVQLRGAKQWALNQGTASVFRPLRTVASPPRKGQHLRDKQRPAHFAATVTLRPGDVLYVPRGVIHNTTTPLPDTAQLFDEKMITCDRPGRGSGCDADAALHLREESPNGVERESASEMGSLHASIGLDPVPHGTVLAFATHLVKAAATPLQQGRESDLESCFGARELAIVVLNALAQRLLVLRETLVFGFVGSGAPPRPVVAPAALPTVALQRLGLCTTRGSDDALGDDALLQQTCARVTRQLPGTAGRGSVQLQEWCVRSAASVRWLCATAAAAASSAAPGGAREPDARLRSLRGQLLRAQETLRRMNAVPPSGALNAEWRPSEVIFDAVREAATFHQLMDVADRWFDEPRCSHLSLSRIVARASDLLLVGSNSAQQQAMIANASRMIGDAMLHFIHGRDSEVEAKGGAAADGADGADDGRDGESSAVALLHSFQLALWRHAASDRPGFVRWAALNEFLHSSSAEES